MNLPVVRRFRLLPGVQLGAVVVEGELVRAHHLKGSEGSLSHRNQARAELDLPASRMSDHGKTSLQLPRNDVFADGFGVYP